MEARNLELDKKARQLNLKETDLKKQSEEVDVAVKRAAEGKNLLSERPLLFIVSFLLYPSYLYWNRLIRLIGCKDVCKPIPQLPAESPLSFFNACLIMTFSWHHTIHFIKLSYKIMCCKLLPLQKCCHFKTAARVSSCIMYSRSNFKAQI